MQIKTEELKQLWREVFVAAIRAGENTAIAYLTAEAACDSYKEAFGQG